MATVAIASGGKWIATLCEALGEDASLIRRIVVDCEVMEPIHVYVEKFADERLLTVEAPPIAAVVVRRDDD